MKKLFKNEPLEFKDRLVDSGKASVIPLPKGTKQTNAGQVCDMLDGPCSCGAWHKSSNQSNSENLETKLCQMFKKVLKDLDTLWFMFSIYIGENQIARGDIVTHKKLVRRLKFLKDKHAKRMAQ